MVIRLLDVFVQLRVVNVRDEAAVGLYGARGVLAIIRDGHDGLVAGGREGITMPAESPRGRESGVVGEAVEYHGAAARVYAEH